VLVLSRKLYESIEVGDDLTITIVGIRAGVVRLGIEAPDGVHVLREELASRQLATRLLEAQSSARPRQRHPMAGGEKKQGL